MSTVYKSPTPRISSPFAALYNQLNSLEVAVEWIGATEAQAYIANMIPNRTPSPNRIQQYANDILSGAWVCTGESLIFLSDGKLANGNHRLRGVIVASETVPDIRVPFLCIRGIPDNGILGIDTNQPRSVTQILGMTGMRSTVPVTSTALAIEFAPALRVPTASAQEKIAIVKKWEELARWGCSVTQFRGCTRAVRAAVCRASLHLGRPKMEVFCRVLATGVPDEGMTAAAYESPLVLRRFLDSIMALSGKDMETERYQKSVAAIDLWRRGMRATRLYGTVDNVFPLPAEKAKESPVNR